MSGEREKPLFLPEAQGEALWPAWPPDEEGDERPDPWARPDLPDLDAEEAPDWLPEMPVEPCPCCGADIPENPSWGYICPLCGWEVDYEVQDDPFAPSDLNHGLSLDEARMNFRVFGLCDPRRLQTEEVQRDASD